MKHLSRIEILEPRIVPALLSVTYIRICLRNMKALVCPLLWALVFSAPLFAAGPIVIFSGNITTTEQSKNPHVFVTATRKNYFILDQSTYTFVRYEIRTVDGVRKYSLKSEFTTQGYVVPTNKSLKGTAFVYPLTETSTTVMGISSQWFFLRGVPNAATGLAIGNIFGAYPPTLSFSRRQLGTITAQGYFVNIEEKGTLSVLRPLSKAANQTPDSLDQAETRLLTEFARLGYVPL